MRRYFRGCSVHRTPDDNSGGRLGYNPNSHPGGIRWEGGLQCGMCYKLQNMVGACAERRRASARGDEARVVTSIP